MQGATQHGAGWRSWLEWEGGELANTSGKGELVTWGGAGEAARALAQVSNQWSTGLHLSPSKAGSLESKGLKGPFQEGGDTLWDFLAPAPPSLGHPFSALHTYPFPAALLYLFALRAFWPVQTAKETFHSRDRGPLSLAQGSVPRLPWLPAKSWGRAF